MGTLTAARLGLQDSELSLLLARLRPSITEGQDHVLSAPLGSTPTPQKTTTWLNSESSTRSSLAPCIPGSVGSCHRLRPRARGWRVQVAQFFTMIGCPGQLVRARVLSAHWQTPAPACAR